MTRVLSRAHKSSQVGGGAVPATAFDSNGVAVVAAAKIEAVLLAHEAVAELGFPALYTYAEATDGQLAETLTVPTGKVWRLVGLVHQQTNSSDVATRTVTVTTRTSADATIEALSSATSVASAETEYSILFGAEGNVVGNDGVAAAGTLTVDTVAAEDEVIVINGVTFTWKDALTAGSVNELLTNTNLAGSKATLEAAFVDRDNGGTLHSVTDAVYAALGMTAIAFATADMVFTANNKGLIGDTLATTTTMAGGNNAWGASTLGDTTAGVGEAGTVSALDFPTAGPLLTAAEDVYIIVTNGEAADDFKGYLFVIEYDASPVTGL